MDHHQLTINEPKGNNWHKQAQLVIISVVLFVCVSYYFITSGGLQNIQQTVQLKNSWILSSNSPGKEGGGTFIYKSAKRDYAASTSLLHHIAYDDVVSILKEQDRANTTVSELELNLSNTNNNNKKYDKFDVIDDYYILYLDHPDIITHGRHRRFACGYYVQHSNTQQMYIKNKLLEMNTNIISPTRSEINNLPAIELWKKLKYKSIQINTNNNPSSNNNNKVLVLNYPYTNGFVSMLLLSIRIIPKLYTIARASPYNYTGPIVIVSTCSIQQSVCTHYVPFMDTTTSTIDTTDTTTDSTSNFPFLLGQQDTYQYSLTLPKQSIMDFILSLFTTIFTNNVHEDHHADSIHADEL